MPVDSLRTRRTFEPTPTARTHRADGAAAGAASRARSPFLRLIDSAENRLYVHVWTTEPAVMNRLIAAQRRGVDVKVLLSFGGPPTPAVRALQERLEHAGIDVRVFTRRALPTEAVVVDERYYKDPRLGRPDTDPGAVAARTREFERALAPPRISDVRPLGPEKVRVHTMPESTAAPIIAAIARARSSIDLSVYELSDSGVTDALRRADARGVRVRVMLEPDPVQGGHFESIARQLRGAGIEVRPTPPFFTAGAKVDHAKFMVIDRAEMLFGTGNLVRSGLGGNPNPQFNNRDFWVQDTRAAAVAEGLHLFDDDWNRRNTRRTDFEHLVITPDNSEEKLFQLIDEARDRVYVYNQALSDPEILEHLLAAKRREVDVRVLVGYQRGAGGVPKNEPAVQRLRAAGVRVDYFTRHYLHAKSVIADDRVFIGSQNFSDGGLERNREMGAILDDPAVVRHMTSTFLGDERRPD